MEITKEIIDQALIELQKIKDNANEEQLELLYKNVHSIDPMSYTHCIYGIMTGDCFSIKAKNLINKCSSKPFYTCHSPASNELDKSYKNLEDTEDSRFYTALELVLTYDPSMIKSKINKMKDEK